MPDLWMPGIPHLTASRSWAMDGGAARYANWHSTENDPSARAIDLAHYLIGIRAEPHFVWNPWTGETVQLLPANRGGSVLKAGNHKGAVNLGVECIGRAGVVGQRPLYDSPMVGFDRILAFMRSWGIPDVWPAGAPLPYPQSAGYGNPQRATFGPSGHYSHSQWPGNDHGDPGLVHLEAFGTSTPTPTPSQGDPLVAVLEGLDFSSPTHHSQDGNRLDVLQLLLAQAGMWIAPNEALVVPDRSSQERYTNIRNVLGTFQVRTGTGTAGKPDWQVGPATAAALCAQKRV